MNPQTKNPDRAVSGSFLRHLEDRRIKRLIATWITELVCNVAVPNQSDTHGAHIKRRPRDDILHRTQREHLREMFGSQHDRLRIVSPCDGGIKKPGEIGAAVLEEA